jgi:septum site-determining protein MinC
MSSQTAVAQQSPAVEFKGSVFTLTILLIRSSDPEEIASDIRERLAQAPNFFLNAPVVLDLAPLKDSAEMLDFSALANLLGEEKLVPVGVCNCSNEQGEAAIEAGLAVMQNSPSRRAEKKAEPKAKPVVEPQIVEVATYVPAKVVTQPVRSGQQVYAKGGDLILLAAVNPGAEVIADGNIHVYAPLRGRALAGVQGDETARIFSLNFGAEMVAIAGHYRIFEEQPSDNVLGKATQVTLEGEKLLVTSMN